jgi:hypothetical protein
MLTIANGNRCGPFAIATRKIPSKLHNMMRYLLRSSPRTISTGQLKPSLTLHLRPIYLIFYEGSYQLNAVGDLILRWASRICFLHAYSVISFREMCGNRHPNIPLASKGFAVKPRLPSGYSQFTAPPNRVALGRGTRKMSRPSSLSKDEANLLYFD